MAVSLSDVVQLGSYAYKLKTLIAEVRFKSSLVAEAVIGVDSSPTTVVTYFAAWRDGSKIIQARLQPRFGH